MPNDIAQDGFMDLAEAIDGLRGELTRAIEKGAEQRARMRFRVDAPVLLEVQAVATTDAHGKVGWKIMELGASHSEANTQKITLKLSPEWWNGKEYTTDFLIAAAVEAGGTFGPMP